MINISNFLDQIDFSGVLYPSEIIGELVRYYNEDWEEITPLEYSELEEKGEECYEESKQLAVCYLMSKEEAKEFIDNYDFSDIDDYMNSSVYMRIDELGMDILLTEDTYVPEELLEVEYKAQIQKMNHTCGYYIPRKIDYSYIANIYNIDTTIKDTGLFDKLLEKCGDPEYIGEYGEGVECQYFNKFGDLISYDNWLACLEYGLEGEAEPKMYDNIYLIKESDARVLAENTEETIVYFEEYGVYFWALNHYSYFNGALVNLSPEQLKTWKGQIRR